MSNIFNKFRNTLRDPVFTTKFHKYATLVWILLLIPGLLFWKESIVFIVLMSLWANIASHWAAYQASRSEVKIDENGSSE